MSEEKKIFVFVASEHKIMDADEILDEEFEEGSDDADNEFQYLNDPSSTQPSSGKEAKTERAAEAQVAA